VYRSTSPPRRIPLSLAVALLLAAAALALSSRETADAQTPIHAHTASAGVVATTSELAFQNHMGLLWEQHAWTRLAIVSFAGNLPDLPAT
jgi:hypothetical protein